MVRLRTHAWPATVLSQEEAEDTSPSARPLRWVKVAIFGKKADRLVKARDISQYPPSKTYHTKKPKEWKDSMDLAEKFLAAARNHSVRVSL